MALALRGPPATRRVARVTRARRVALRAAPAPSPEPEPAPAPSPAPDTPEPGAPAFYSLAVKDVCTPDVVTIPGETPLRDAMRTLLNNQFGAAPVVDKDGVMLGLLSKTDVLWKEAGVPSDHWIVRPTWIPVVDAQIQIRNRKHFFADVTRVLALTALDACTKEPLTCRPDDSLNETVKRMLDAHVSAMPVVDVDYFGAESLVGIVTRTDVVRALYEHADKSLNPV